MAQKLKFLPYQRKYVKFVGRFALVEKSRRTGLTYAEAYRMTRRHASGIVKSGKSWFTSADLSAAEEYIDYVAFFSKYLNIASEYVGEVVISKEDDVTAHRVRFSNGNECNAISSNPTRFRSKGGDVTLDEFAHHKDQQKMYTAAKPSIMWGNHVRIISTHNGDGSYFNFLIKEILKGAEGAMKNWKLFKVTIDDAVKQGLVNTILGHKASKEETAEFLSDAFSGMSREAIDEEFRCIPRSSSNDHLLPYELINAIERDNILNELLTDIQGDLYIGVDVGRKKNFTVIWVDEKLGEILYTRKVTALRNTAYRDQKKILYDILSHPNIRRCCIDATGIGSQMAEEAQQDYGQFKVEPIIFTNKIKEEMASHAFVMVEGKKTLIPRDKRIRDDFYSVRATRTTAGNIRYEAETSDEGSHADYFWAKALCLYASKTNSGPLIITSGGTRLINEILRGYW
jgi:phage FluMu gp28-like protein